MATMSALTTDAAIGDQSVASISSDVPGFAGCEGDFGVCAQTADVNRSDAAMNESEREMNMRTTREGVNAEERAFSTVSATNLSIVFGTVERRVTVCAVGNAGCMVVRP